MRMKLENYAPPGIKLQQEKVFFLTGLILCSLYSFGFFLRYQNALSELYRQVGRKRVLIPGATLPDYIELLDDALLGCVILGLCMVALIFYHYAYYRRGSQSIYLMRRLPDGSVLHRQCLTLPLLAIALCLLLAVFLFFLYYLIYQIVSPDSCVVPGQWQRMWRLFL